MPQIMVMSRQDAKAYSYRNHAKTSVIVSITDVESPYNRFSTLYSNNIKAILPIKFNDVDVGQDLCIAEKDAKKIADFVMDWSYKVDVIIVHCEAGISRSAGVAAAILKHLYDNDSQIFKSGYG